MKHLFSVIMASAALIVASPAVAGEISGNGKYVPGGDKGASQCSYSGLNDDADGQGFLQSFAWYFKAFGIPVGFFFNAGDFCQGR